MHHTSLSKIESASSFLLWFRTSLPPDLQEQLRPYLAQPYQSALKVLDCCSSTHPITLDAISEQTQLSKDSVRQMLKVLQTVGLVAATNSVKGWKTQTSPEVDLANLVRSRLPPLLPQPVCSSSGENP